MSAALRLRILGASESSYLQASPVRLAELAPALAPHLRRWVIVADGPDLAARLRGAGVDATAVAGAAAIRREDLERVAALLPPRALLADAAALPPVEREPRALEALRATSRSGLPSPPGPWNGAVALLVRGEALALGTHSRGTMLSVASEILRRFLREAAGDRGERGLREPSPLLIERLAQRSHGRPLEFNAAGLEATPTRLRLRAGETLALVYRRSEGVWDIEAA